MLYEKDRPNRGSTMTSHRIANEREGGDRIWLPQEYRDRSQERNGPLNDRLHY
jgi:hypothetical protein